jgi:hypothetical protein
MANVSIQNDPMSLDQILTVSMTRQLDASTQHSVIREALKDVAKAYAESWLEENRDKIFERLNVDAIANMIMLEVANQTKDDVLKKESK